MVYIQHTLPDVMFVHGAQLLKEKIENVLVQHKKFTLFLSGGSAVSVYKELISWVENTSFDLSKSVALLVDERYSIDPNHAGSNARAIEESGFFDALRARNVGIETILHGRSMEEEVKRYNNVLRLSFPRRRESILNDNAFSIGIFGIGLDGHTAGIFPTKTLEEFRGIYGNLEEGEMVVGHYNGLEPFRDRITITPLTIRKITHKILIAYGEGKKGVLNELQTGEKPVYQFPGRLLNSKDIVLITD